MSNILTNNINPRSGNLITIGGVNDRVSIAGTLSYEDVTNIDSVGIITARDGLDTPTDLVLRTGGTEQVRIDSSGDMGVGTTSPQNNLHLSSSSATTRFQITNSTTAEGSSDGTALVQTGNTFLINNRENDDIYFATNNSEAMRIDSSGRLLVGTTSSSSNDTLVLQGNSAGANFGAQFRLRRNATIGSGTGIGDINFEDSSGNQYAVISGQGDGTSGSGDYPGRLVFSTTADGASSPTERLRIDSAGRLLVGTTGSTWPYKIVTEGGIGFSAGSLAITRAQAGSATASGGDMGYLAFGGNDDSTFALISAWADGTTGLNDYPGRLVFSTTADGASFPTERVRIANNGMTTLSAGSETVSCKIANVKSVAANTTGTITTVSGTAVTLLVVGQRGSNGSGIYLAHRGSNTVTLISTTGTFAGGLAWSGNELRGTAPGAGNVTWSMVQFS